MYKQKQGFTLVELIVVITILAILGTIAIMAFSGYSKNARDSARISDIGNMKKSLELWILQSGTYPDPSSGTGVTYSGATVWLQGTFGDSVTSTVGKLDKKPVDPKYDTEYTYSVTQSKKEYQIGAVLEKDMASNNPILSQTYAAETTGEAYVSGTYNGILTTVGTNPTYIVALPSIILSSLTTTELKTVSSNTLVYEGKATLPASYANVGLTMTGSDFTFTPTVVWSGATIDALNNQTEFQNLVTNLQTTYQSNEAFATLPEYTSIVSEGDKSVGVMSFVKGLLEINTSKELTNVSTTPLIICSPGSYSVTGNTPCTQTSAGYYTSTQGATTQTECPENTWCAEGSSSPTQCSVGYISPSGSTNVSACAFNGIAATGGNITTYSSGGINYKVHTFTTVGSHIFTVTSGNQVIDYLIVAGGGGGYTSGFGSGGGGAGGYLAGTLSVTSGTYPITVGAGGVGGYGGVNLNTMIGGNSVFSSITAYGGGHGGLGNASNGGSGGGGGGNAGFSGMAGIASPEGQGNNGGPGGPYMYAGGGGAGGPGSLGPAQSGLGGPGLENSISGLAVNYAAGGRGYPNNSIGAANTGNGGGGGQGNNGGSGIIIIRYQIP